MSGDDTLPVEDPPAAPGLMDVLECPVCLEYMAPPITMCSSGHSVCGDCKPRLHSCPTCRQPLLDIRNFALESLARELQVPERTETALPPQCPSEPVYGCPLECPWTGLRSEMWQHMSQTHSNKILEGTRQNRCTWELPLIVRDARVMFAFGEVFLYRQRLHTIKKMFYVVVQYVGPVKNACKYRYEAEFRSSKGEQKVIMIGNITVGLHEDIDAICEAGNCVTMEYDVVKSMAEGNQLLYAVRVLKPGSTLE